MEEYSELLDEELMKMIERGEASIHEVFLDKDGNITENEEEWVEGRVAVFDNEGILLYEAFLRKPSKEELEWLKDDSIDDGVQ